MTGVEIIAAERQRQVTEEGWTPEHDATHINGQMSRAAACYALPRGQLSVARCWPWHHSWWKPSPNNRVRELAKAGALIAAEIDRLQALGAAGEENANG